MYLNLVTYWVNGTLTTIIIHIYGGLKSIYSTISHDIISIFRTVYLSLDEDLVRWLLRRDWFGRGTAV